MNRPSINDLANKDPKEQLSYFLQHEIPSTTSVPETLAYLGLLVDASLDMYSTEGITYAHVWAETLYNIDMESEYKCQLHYIMANIWANERVITNHNENTVTRRDPAQAETSQSWENPSIEKQILFLRKAINEDQFSKTRLELQCMVLTNLANVYDQVGRFVEAIEYWQRALTILPDFGDTHGDLGIGLSSYARILYDPGHQGIFMFSAMQYLSSALDLPLHPSHRTIFHKQKALIEQSYILPSNVEDIVSKEYDLGDNEEEIQYRLWCLKHRLFINPLNDLTTQSIAAHDPLTAPSIVYGIGDAPYYHGFYNQLKQEYVSARFMYFDSRLSKKAHYSDRDVAVYNTLDYPVYALAAEKMKAVYRVTYSLFDKVAYFLNAYMQLGIPDRSINFRTIWYSNPKKKVIRENLLIHHNRSLCGLYWLSKDLFRDEEGFRDATEPDARDLHTIRNFLEHKYLKLHSEYIKQGKFEGANPTISTDILAYSIYYDDFCKKTLRLLKIARACLIYLSLMIHVEEYHRQDPSDERVILPQFLDNYEDDWKFIS